jgi:hypothetical protein
LENGLIILEMDSVREILGQTQVIFIHAYGCLVLEQGVNVLAPVWFWCSEMTFVFNFFSGPHSLFDYQ